MSISVEKHKSEVEKVKWCKYWQIWFPIPRSGHFVNLALNRKDRSPCPRLTLPSLRTVSIPMIYTCSQEENIPSSFSSSFASAAPPPEAAPAAGAPPPPPPPDGTEASFVEPEAINYASLVSKGTRKSSVIQSYLVNILALKLGDQAVEAAVVSLDADGAQNLLNIGCRRGGVSTEGEEEVCCEMLHCVVYL